MLWSHSLKDLKKFTDSINKLYSNIKCTLTASEWNIFNMLTFPLKAADVKPTNIHQYFKYNSFYSNACKQDIPYRQAT